MAVEIHLERVEAVDHDHPPHVELPVSEPHAPLNVLRGNGVFIDSFDMLGAFEKQVKGISEDHIGTMGHIGRLNEPKIIFVRIELPIKELSRQFRELVGQVKRQTPPVRSSPVLLHIHVQEILSHEMELRLERVSRFLKNTFEFFNRIRQQRRVDVRKDKVCIC